MFQKLFRIETDGVCSLDEKDLLRDKSALEKRVKISMSSHL